MYDMKYTNVLIVDHPSILDCTSNVAFGITCLMGGCLKPWDFSFKLQEFDGYNVEWSWLYNCAHVELWNENTNKA